MPDSSAINVQLADRTESELQRVERDLSTLQDRKLTLEAQLAVVGPNLALAGKSGEGRTLAPEERLRALQAQYASVSAVYGPDHPDVRRLQREIAALKARTEPSIKGDNSDEVKKLEAELSKLRDRYGDDYPDVQRVRRSIEALKAAGAKPTAGAAAPDKRLPADALQTADNPAYVVLATQLENTKRELAQLTALRDDLRAKQRTYDARLQQIPEVEREYNDLTRDYANAQTRYREIKAKQMQAEGAVELEKESKAERFSLGEPANLPAAPFSPNRPMIALAGLVASLGSGVGLAWLREAVDPSVRGPLELARIARVPLLTAIPYIETHREHIGKRRLTLLLAGAYSLFALIFLLGVHFFVKPLPALFQSVLHQIAVL